MSIIVPMCVYTIYMLDEKVEVYYIHCLALAELLIEYKNIVSMRCSTCMNFTMQVSIAWILLSTCILYVCNYNVCSNYCVPQMIQNHEYIIYCIIIV